MVAGDRVPPAFTGSGAFYNVLQWTVVLLHVKVGGGEVVQTVAQVLGDGERLEKYFREKLALSDDFSFIGRYWEKGNQNEIDIVAFNEIEKHLLIAEVKRNKSKISPASLKVKSGKLLQALNGYTVQYKGFSLDDM